MSEEIGWGAGASAGAGEGEGAEVVFIATIHL